MSRVEGVLNWYTENDKNDPNMYELVEVLSEYSRGADDSKERVESLVELEVKRLFTNRIIKDQNDSLVKMIQEFKEKALNGEAIPQVLENYAKKIAGVSFWIKQEERNGNNIVYNNIAEYKNMLQMENDAIMAGSSISGSIKELRDYIDVHCDDNLNELRNSYFDYKKSTEKKYNRMELLVMQTEPYVYPEKYEKMLKYANSLLDASIETIVALGKGNDFDNVYNMLKGKDLSGAGLGFVVSQAALYAKNGPEFFMFMCDKDGTKLDEGTSTWIEDLKKENQELAEAVGEDTIGSSHK